MAQLSSPVLRLLDGLEAGTGRTLVIAGPPLSGKSDLVQTLRTEVVKRGGRVHNLRGEHRFRDLAYSALETLDQAAPDTDAAASAPGSAEEMPTAGFAFVPINAEPPPTSRRRGDRGRSPPSAIHLTGPRVRNPLRVEPEEFWSRMVAEVRGSSGAPVLICVDEGAFVDAESREVLLYLSDRARLRPIALILSMDTSIPSYGVWEERLVGHGDVDWVRLPRSREDPRDVRRAEEDFERLPEACRRVLGLTALLRGPVSEVTLSRVTRMTFGQLADALLPATEAGLIKVEGGKVSFPHAAFANQIPEMIPEATKADMHREIAEALAALNPEPSLDRRLELAHHYYEWYRGPNALRYLMEIAELTERLHAYDTTCEALEQARSCIPSLPVPDRLDAETEIRMQQVRALAYAGRLPEAEQALREGVTAALDGKLPEERLEEWIEGLVPVLESIGPRPGLINELVELAERCHDAGAGASEILLQSVLARHDLDRGRIAKAREEANRAARLSRSMVQGPAQALALLAVGVTRTEGTPDEQKLAARFLHSAEVMLGRSRRYGLQLEAQEAELTLKELLGDRDAVRRAREKALPAAHRLRNLPLELAHNLAIASLLLDGKADARVVGVLKRAREIVETLHLVPPAPGLLRLWIVEGRYQADTNSPTAARDRFDAVAEQPASMVSAERRAEARLRLAILEATSGRDEAARSQVLQLARPELRNALRPEWKEWLEPLERRFHAAATHAAHDGKSPGSSA